MKTMLRMMEHMHWANAEILDVVEKNGVDDPDILRLLRHMAIAEQVWLIRLNGGSSRHLQLWEAGDATEVAALMRANDRGYRDYMALLTEADLDGTIAYTNQQGTPFEMPVRDILIHVTLHGQYHRGQVNRMLVSGKVQPVVFDFIAFARL
ncbi:DinB family protein [Paenibacillus daejeonensis]|uniref:DinB family protein n=1 Tax=Paenibacillus daejeonensis TaxID=135193 RepID=UPI0003665EEB|nr:DinB family protein [Paenibacillus daejeonensis]